MLSRDKTGEIMENRINIQEVRIPSYQRLSDQFFGTDPDGREIGFNNYYMLMDGKPFFGISGECHYSRVPEERWEDTLLKMKAGGINTVATYVFWIHHEVQEGVFDFSGQRDVGEFMRICGEEGLYVWLRIGPWCHGECRHGGFPEWLMKKELT